MTGPSRLCGVHLQPQQLATGEGLVWSAALTERSVEAQVRQHRLAAASAWKKPPQDRAAGNIEQSNKAFLLA